MNETVTITLNKTDYDQLHMLIRNLKKQTQQIEQKDSKHTGLTKNVALIEDTLLRNQTQKGV